MLQYAVPLFVDGEDTLMQSRGFRNNITYTFEGDVTRSLRTSDTLLQFWKCERTDFVEEAHAHLSYLQENGCWDFDANTILNGVIGEALFCWTGVDINIHGQELHRPVSLRTLLVRAKPSVSLTEPVYAIRGREC